MILIHLGSNDIGTIKTFNLIENIETDILRLKLLFLNCLIIWSELLMRRYWYNAKKGTAYKKLEGETHIIHNSMSTSPHDEHE
jgi:hypothetical protein